MPATNPRTLTEALAPTASHIIGSAFAASSSTQPIVTGPARHVEEEASGIIATGTEVKMASRIDNAVDNTHFSRNGETLWTRALDTCVGIATYDHNSGQRSLVHLRAGSAENEYYTILAGHIAEDASVIIVAGANSGSSKTGFVAMGDSKRIKDAFRGAMTAAGKNPARLTYVIFWKDREAMTTGGMKPGSFGITADGRYGPVRA